jgi:predicted permease
MPMNPFRKRRRSDEEFAEEIASHLQLEVDDLKSEGYSESEANRRARTTFNNPTLAQERFRIRHRIHWLDNLLRDLHFAFRQFHRSPGFALTAILTLTLGLGSNTAIFSLMNGLLLRPLPAPHADRLAILRIDRSDFETPIHNFNTPVFRALEKRKEIFQALAASSESTLQVRDNSAIQQIPGLLVSGQFFETLGTLPLKGRYLTPADDQDRGASGGFAAVISESFWRSWFESVPDVVGRKLIIANTTFIVAGVMPAQFIGADPTERPNIFIPLSAEPIVDAPFSFLKAGYHANWLHIIARLQPNMSAEQTNAALQADTFPIFEQSGADANWIKDAHANHYRIVSEPGSTGWTYFRQDFKKPLVAVFWLCGAILLLACLNLASLLMAKAAARERELATRLAIGASRRRLIQQLLVETLLIAAFGVIAGLALAPIVSRVLAALLLSGNPYSVLDTSLDWRVFLFAALITGLACLLIGLVPALRATAGDLNEHIKNGSYIRSSRDKQRGLVPRLLLGSEVALALMLVIGATLLAASLTRLYHAGLGFDPSGLVNLRLDVDKQSLEGQALLNWYQQLTEGLAHQPGVRDVSYESNVPLDGSNRTNTFPIPGRNGHQEIYMNVIAPDYFATMRIPMFAGRDFRWQDNKTSGEKIILNQSAANIFFPGRSPLGQFITDDNNIRSEVIAVVGDVKHESIRQQAPPSAYVAMTQTMEKKQSFTAVVRLEGPIAPLASAARNLITRTGPDIPVPVMTTMSSTLDDSISTERMMAMLSIFFAAFALIVTAIGLYGTLAYSTARRTSEIGIRMALGAQRLQVVLLVFRENLWSTAFGSLGGLGIALIATRALSSFLYGTSVRDPWILIASVAALTLIASVASLLPAVRAARIDPIQALRTE